MPAELRLPSSASGARARFAHFVRSSGIISRQRNETRYRVTSRQSCGSAARIAPREYAALFATLKRADIWAKETVFSSLKRTNLKIYYIKVSTVFNYFSDLSDFKVSISACEFLLDHSRVKQEVKESSDQL